MQLGELHKRRLDSENPAKKASRLFEMPVGLGPGTTCFVGNNWTKPKAKNILARICRLGRDLETMSELSEAPTDNASACAVPTSRANPGQSQVT